MFKKIYLKFKNIYNLLKENNLTTIAGSWTFFLLLTIVPLVFLLLITFGFFKLDLSSILRESFLEEYNEIFDRIVSVAKNGAKEATFFFLITAAYTASSLFFHIIKDGELIYLQKRKNSIIRKIFSFLALLVFFLVFIILAGIIVINYQIIALFPKSEFFKLISKILINLIAFLFLYAIIVLLNLLIAPIKIRLSYLFLTSLISSAIIILGSIGFGIYTRYVVSYENLYGNLATLIIFLIWLYIIMLGLVIGVILNKYFNLKSNQSNLKNNKSNSKSSKGKVKNVRNN